MKDRFDPDTANNGSLSARLGCRMTVESFNLLLAVAWIVIFQTAGETSRRQPKVRK
jgi:hypothetical protein